MPADTFSATLGFLEMGTGNDNNTWGNNANTAVFQIFEDAIANALTSNVTGGTLDLSGSPPPAAASQVRYAALIFAGVLGSNQTIKVPNLTKWWWVNNQTSGAFTLKIQTPSGSVSTAIPQNSGWQLVQCDGNNNIIVSPFNSLQIQMPDGSVSAPPFSDINETNSGLYRHGAGDWRFSILGVDVLQITSTAINALQPLQNSGVQVIPPGVEVPFAGISVPTGWYLENGQTVSRAGDPNLLAALRISFTCTFSNGSPTLSSVSQDLRGLGLEGATLECATSGITNLTISSIAAASITMSGNASGNSGGTVTVFAYPWGNGDGVSTFTLPDRRDVTIAGRGNMGGTDKGNLTGATALNAALGAQNVTLTQANLPNVSFTISGITLNDPGHTHLQDSTTLYDTGSHLDPGTNNSIRTGSIATKATQSATTGITISNQGTAASGGSGTAHSLVQPTGISNYIIKR